MTLALAPRPICAADAWFIASETQPESCPAGLVVDGPEVTPASTAYTLGMLFWCFYGVSIGADLFMEAIETIVRHLPRSSPSMALPWPSVAFRGLFTDLL